MQFPAKRNAGCPKAPPDIPPRKRWHYPPPPRRVALALPSPSPRVCKGRTDGLTLTSEPKFLGLIGYQICLPMELRSAAFGRKGAPL